MHRSANESSDLQALLDAHRKIHAAIRQGVRPVVTRFDDHWYDRVAFGFTEPGAGRNTTRITSGDKGVLDLPQSH